MVFLLNILIYLKFNYPAKHYPLHEYHHNYSTNQLDTKPSKNYFKVYHLKKFAVLSDLVYE